MSTITQPPSSQSLFKKLLGWIESEARSKNFLLVKGKHALRLFIRALLQSDKDRIPFEASGLTFVTLLGLVPALALSFAIAKSLGLSDNLRTSIVVNLGGYQKDFLDKIFDVIAGTKLGALGALGLLVFVVSIVSAISTVEDTLNRIWGASKQRAWARRFSDYVSLVVVIPILISAATTVFAYIASVSEIEAIKNTEIIGDLATFGLSLVPLFVLTSAFTFIYSYLPNVKVPTKSALFGAIVSALLWWGVQTVYIEFQVGVVKYNTVYGGFATVPLFMMWVQVSWMVVLFGAELAHAHHVGSRPGLLTPKSSGQSLCTDKAIATAMLMWEIASDFHAGKMPRDIFTIASQDGIDSRTAEQALHDLAGARLVTTEETHSGLIPAKCLSKITLAEVFRVAFGLDTFENQDAHTLPILKQFNGSLKKGGEHLSKTTLLDCLKSQED
jgi:membrane protein